MWFDNPCLKEALAKLSPHPLTVLARHEPAEGAEPNECFKNVLRQVIKAGPHGVLPRLQLAAGRPLRGPVQPRGLGGARVGGTR